MKYLNVLKKLSREDATNKILVAFAVLFLAASVVPLIDDNHEEGFSADSIRTIDGDTLEAFYNGSSVTVRFIGVDTPETFVENNPEEFGLSDTEEHRECLKHYAKESTRYVEHFTGPETRIVTDKVSDTYGYYGRLLAYIKKDNRSLNRELLERGYARVYESEFAYLEEYRTLEEQAREQERGVWSC